MQQTISQLPRTGLTGQVSLQTLVRSAWILLLAKYEAQTDILIEHAGRPLHLDVSHQRTISSLICEVQGRCTDSIKHSAADLQPLFPHGSSAAATTAYSVTLSFDSLPGHNQPHPRDIHFLATFAEASSTITITVENHHRHTTSPQLVRFLRQLSHVVESIASLPTAAFLSDVDFVHFADLDDLQTWNSSVPNSLDVCLHDLFSRHVYQTPDKIAIDASDGQITYSVLHLLSSQVAAHLLNFGVGPGSFVPTCFEKSKWNVVANLGVLMAGAAFTPIAPTLPSARINAITSQCEVRVGLASAQHAQLLESAVDTVITVDEHLRHLDTQTCMGTVAVRPTDLAYAIFTSGSTGTPKGVLIEHRNISTGLTEVWKALNLDRDSRVLQFASHSFDFSIQEMFGTLISGATLCIPDELDLLDDVCAVLRDMQVTHCLLTTTLSRLFPSKDFPRLPSVALGGEAITDSDVQNYVGRVDQFLGAYGPSECTPISYVVHFENDRVPGNDLGKSVGCVGWVVDAYDPSKLVPIGAVGELVLEGPIIGRGYLKNESKTSEVFIQRPNWLKYMFPGRRGRLYRTGDLVRGGSDGSIQYLGRRDTQVKIRGLRVELGEIEEHMRRFFHGKTAVAADVVSFSDSQEVLVGFLTNTESDSAVDDQGIQLDPKALRCVQGISDSLRPYLSQHLVPYMVPAVFCTLSSLPLTPAGKIDRRKLHVLAAGCSLAERARLLEQLDCPTSCEARLKARLIDESVPAFSLLANAQQANLEVAEDSDIPLSSIADMWPCSDFQARAVHVSRRSPSAHLEQCVLVVPPTISDSTVRGAWMDAVQKDVTLRSFCLDTSYGLLQIVRTSESVQSSISTRRSPLAECLTSEKKRGIDTGTTLFRAILVSDQEQRYLVLTMHHALFERQSLHALVDRLRRYIAGAVSMPCPNPALLARYDKQKDVAQARDAWRVYLQGFEGIQLLAKPGPGYQPLADSMIMSRVPRATPSRGTITTLQAAWALALAKHGQATYDVVFGSVVSGRSLPLAGIETMPGPAAAIVPVRVRLPQSCQTVAEYLQQIEDDYAIVRPHERLGMHKIAKTSREAAMAVRFSSLLLLDKNADNPLGGLAESCNSWLIPGVYGYPVVLDLTTDEGDCAIRMSFDRNLIDQEKARELLDLLAHVFVRLCTSDADHLASEIDVLLPSSHLSDAWHNGRAEGSSTGPPSNSASEDHSDDRTDSQSDTGVSTPDSTVADSSAVDTDSASDNDHLMSERGDQVEASHRPLRPFQHSPLVDLSESQSASLQHLALSRDSLLGKPLVEDIYPVTPLQSGMLLQMWKDDNAYRVRTFMELKPADVSRPLDLNRLGSAWQLVVERHASLRTMLIQDFSVASEALQVVLGNFTAPIRYSHATTKEDAIHRHSQLRRDISLEPYQHMTFYELANKSVVCALDIGHALTDGWSNFLLLQDFLDAYDGCFDKTYRTSLRGFLEYLTPERQLEANEAWIERLRGCEPCILPEMDGLGESKDTPLAEFAANFVLDGVDYPSVCKELSITASVFFQTVLALTIRVFTGNDEAVFGFISSGRDAPVGDLEATCGALFNTLVCRMTLHTLDSVKALLQQRQQDHLDSLDYQHYSLPYTQHAIKLAGRRFFNTVLSVHVAPAETTSDEEQSSRTVGQIVDLEDPTEYDMVVGAVTSSGSPATLSFTGSQRAFSERHVQQFGEVFVQIARSICEDVDCDIGEIELLPREAEIELSRAYELANTGSWVVDRNNADRLMPPGAFGEVLVRESKTKPQAGRRQPTDQQRKRVQYTQTPRWAKHTKNSRKDRFFFSGRVARAKYDMSVTETLPPPTKVEAASCLPAPSNDEEVGGPATATTEENTIRTVWAKVLGLSTDSFGSTTSFYQLGGDSIAAMRVAMEAREAGLHINIRDVLKHPTIRGMADAARLKSAHAAKAIPSTSVVAKKGDSPPTAVANKNADDAQVLPLSSDKSSARPTPVRPTTSRSRSWAVGRFRNALEFWGLDTSLRSRETSTSFLLPSYDSMCVLTSSNVGYGTQPADLVLAALLHSFSATFPDRAMPLLPAGSGNENLNAPTPSTGCLPDIAQNIRDLRAAGRLSIGGSKEQDEQSEAPKTPFELHFHFQPQSQPSDDTPGALVGIQQDVPSSLANASRSAILHSSVHVDAGQLACKLTYDSDMQHQDRIRSWWMLFEKTLTNIAISVPKKKYQHPVQYVTANHAPSAVRKAIAAVSLDENEVLGIVPATPMQQYMLQLERDDLNVSEGYVAFKIHYAEEKHGLHAILQDGWQKIVDRHDMLRTIFIHTKLPNQTRDWQVILRQVQVTVDEYIIDRDFDHRTVVQKPASSNPLKPGHSLALYRSKSGAAFAVLHISHLYRDLFSLRALQRDITLALNAGLDKTPFMSYTEGRRLLQNTEEDDSIEFWNKYYDGLTPCRLPTQSLALPWDGQATQEVAVVLPTLGALRQLCNTQRVTMNSIIHAAWSATLFILTNQDSVCFDYITPSRGQRIDGILFTIGPYHNLHVNKASVHDDSSLLDVLTAVHDDFIDALPHHGTSAPEVAGQAVTSLASTLVSVMRWCASTWDYGYRTWAEEVSSMEPLWHDVALRCTETPINISARLQYRADRVRSGTAERMALLVKMVLESMVLSPKTSRIKDLRLVYESTL